MQTAERPSATCAECGERVRSAPRLCPGCGTAYHERCSTLRICVVPGCSSLLDPPQPEPAPAPGIQPAPADDVPLGVAISEPEHWVKDGLQLLKSGFITASLGIFTLVVFKATASALMIPLILLGLSLVSWIAGGVFFLIAVHFALGPNRFPESWWATATLRLWFHLLLLRMVTLVIPGRRISLIGGLWISLAMSLIGLLNDRAPLRALVACSLTILALYLAL